ncbi:RibD family protein [Vampirovibrio chlorellavorus]|uniref:RibD family protein n=1 Tax=Vampirovibrio chlorellavorus TaxID=758823 RepID=UPI0026F32E37|nr:RibD family protein [Vampirovibrio chlorellavorus]
MRIIACLAASLDGRIGSATNLKDRIGTSADLEHLLTVRNQADAILCGGETFRQHAAIRKGNQQERPPLQCILTRRFALPPEARLFQQSISSDPPTPILIVSPQPAPLEIQSQYPDHVEWLTTGNSNPVPAILKALAEKGVETLMVEGGGHIMNLFLQAQAIHELYLTICPLLLGGQSDPGLVTGLGFPVGQAPRTEVIQADWRGQELYLHLKLQYPSPAEAD